MLEDYENKMKMRLIYNRNYYKKGLFIKEC